MSFPKDPPLLPVALCIPVRDEAQGLPALIDGLAGQRGCPPGSLRLCLFFDGCTDGSAAVAQEAARRLPHPLHTRVAAARHPPNAGRARGTAMALGVEALAGRDGLLLTTDADSVPAPDWVARCHAALAMADVVAGRIVREPWPPSPAQDRVEHYYDLLHDLRRRIDPVPWEGDATHHCTGGANLGFRAAAYRAVGGFAPLASGEDARIVDDAARAGLRVRRDATCIVRTSARRVGRAEGGLALALRNLDEGGGRVRVAHPADAAWQYRMQALARTSFDGALDDLSDALGLTRDHLIGVARDCPNGEAFAMRVVPTPPGGMRQVALDKAEVALAALLARDLETVA